MQQEVSIFWFKKDLRIEDNSFLRKVLSKNRNVLSVYISSPEESVKNPNIKILTDKIKREFQKHGSDLLVLTGNLLDVWIDLSKTYKINKIFYKDSFHAMTDEELVLLNYFEQNKISVEAERLNSGIVLKNLSFITYEDFKRSFLESLEYTPGKEISHKSLLKMSSTPVSDIEVKINLSKSIRQYGKLIKNTDLLIETLYQKGGIDLHKLLLTAYSVKNENLIDFIIFDQFCYFLAEKYPHSTISYKANYDKILWPNNVKLFEQWRDGQTGYPLIDAGMRQLKETGHLNYEIRKICAIFLCKILHFHWKWGDYYFSKSLLNYDPVSSKYFWQWIADAGPSTLPYFMLKNPDFALMNDPDRFTYIKEWIPEYKGKAHLPKAVIFESAQVDGNRLYMSEFIKNK